MGQVAGVISCTACGGAKEKIVFIGHTSSRLPFGAIRRTRIVTDSDELQRSPATTALPVFEKCFRSVDHSVYGARFDSILTQIATKPHAGVRAKSASTHSRPRLTSPVFRRNLEPPPATRARCCDCSCRTRPLGVNPPSRRRASNPTPTTTRRPTPLPARIASPFRRIEPNSITVTNVSDNAPMASETISTGRNNRWPSTRSPVMNTNMPRPAVV